MGLGLKVVVMGILILMLEFFISFCSCVSMLVVLLMVGKGCK